jgi:hypothetical protein
MVDVRGLQGATADASLNLLRTARSSLPERALIGLVDPDRPALSPLARACLDSICADPHAARQARPECFVRLAPCDDDAAFTARLLLDPAIPSVGLEAMGAHYWQSCVDLVSPAETLWASAATLRRTTAPARLAVLSAATDLPLCRTLRRRGADVFGPQIVAALSPHYDQSLFVLTNTANAAPLLRLLRRFGGSAVVLDSCLLAAYDETQAAELAERELGRPVPQAELLMWRAGIARPPALLLGDVAAVADRLFVQSTWLADEIARRYGRTAEVVPQVPDLPRLHAHASGLQAESCVWAVEMLRFWEREVRLDLLCRPDERPALAELAVRLGVDDLIGFTPGPASLTLALAMRGQESVASTRWPDIASRSVVEALDADVVIVPDQPSPLLLAEAIVAALAPPAPCDTAQRIMTALGF